jgi:hypothetical protein
MYRCGLLFIWTRNVEACSQELVTARVHSSRLAVEGTVRWVTGNTEQPAMHLANVTVDQCCFEAGSAEHWFEGSNRDCRIIRFMVQKGFKSKQKLISDIFSYKSDLENHTKNMWIQSQDTTNVHKLFSSYLVSQNFIVLNSLLKGAKNDLNALFTSVCKKKNCKAVLLHAIRGAWGERRYSSYSYLTPVLGGPQSRSGCRD